MMIILLGRNRAEPNTIKVKDFDKIALTAKGGAVFCGEIALEVNGKAVTCDVADGNGIH